MRQPTKSPPEACDAAADGEKCFTTGEMARLSNNTLRTVRFYEEAGILSPLRRTEGGHRLFDQRELDRLMLVTDMRAAGLSLEQIRELLEAKRRARSGGEAAKQATLALEGHLEALREKLAMLSRLHDDLAETVEVAAGCLDCPEDAAGAAGPGRLFPDRCGECGKLTERGSLPRGMQILWSVRGSTGRGSGPEADASGAVATADDPIESEPVPTDPDPH